MKDPFNKNFSRFYNFDELFELQPYANPHKKIIRRNQIIANVEGLIGPRDCVDKISEAQIPQYGIYQIVVEFQGELYTYLGHSADAVWTRCAKHISKIFFRISNAEFPEILKKRIANNCALKNALEFSSIKFKDQYELSLWAYGSSRPNDKILNLGSFIAEKNRTYEAQKKFASEKMKFRFWGVPQSGGGNTIHRTRLCESMCMLQYKIKNGDIPNLNQDDETTPAKIYARIENFKSSDLHKKNKDFFQIKNFIAQYET